MKVRAWGLLSVAVFAQVCVGATSSVATNPGTGGPSRPAWCPPSATQASLPNRLPAIAAKLRRGETITVVAIGSSSTEGSDLPDRLLAYPTQLQRQLVARFGPGTVQVLNKGRGGETMIETVARFSSDVAGEKPDLVIWQLGVNDIVRSLDMVVSERTIEDGMSQLRSVGAPIVLMDMQLAPRVTASPALPMMKNLLNAAALKHEAMLWSRYALMDSIVKSGDAKLVDLIKPDDLHMTVAMHVCTGAVLGDAIAATATATAAPVSGVVASKAP
jgi:acyl-CoA thioesterase I